MANRLRNKVAIVTGGGAGIGEAICKKFALEGAKVVVCGLPNDPVREVVREIESQGGYAIPFLGDISQAVSAKACVEAAVETYGKLDILINNAGVFPAVGYIHEYPVDALDYLLRNNVQSVFMMTRFAVPYLQKSKGCIVAAGSEAGIDGDAQNAPYAGTKGFIHSFIRSVAVEQAQYGVRANVVCPGPIDTSWTHHESSPMTAKMEKQFISATPMGRRGTTEEVANVYLFLASDEASYVTGALYTVDGGITISKGPVGLMADSSMKKEPEGELDVRHSKHGDPVARPFKKTQQSVSGLYDDDDYLEKSSNLLRNTLIGLGGVGLAAVAVNLASRYWGKSNDASEVINVNQGTDLPVEQNQGANLNSGAGAESAAATAGTATATGATTDQPQSSRMSRKNATDPATGTPDAGGGNNKGFTNEAATGNND